jgi:choline dehydrogenase-like flavoprotein
MTEGQFDYIIVGGGSAGCVLAARLTENPGINVALLEAGPTDRSVLIHCPAGLAVMARTGVTNWQFETTAQPGLNGRRGYQPRGKVLGGSSSINAMVYIRGQREDYDRWAAMGNPGWSYDDVLPYFKRAEDNARGEDDFHGIEGPLRVMDLTSPNPLGAAFLEAALQAGHAPNPDFNGENQEGVGPYQVTQRKGERCSAAKAYLTPIHRRPNIRVFTRAHTTRILVEHKRAVGVEFVRDGETLQLRCAREVLVCAGALQSPQILMLSGIGPHKHLVRHGIAPVHDLPGVGQNLHDHIDIAQVVHAPGLTPSFGLSPTGVLNAIKGAVEWRKYRTGMLTTNFAEVGGFIKSQPSERTPDLQLHFVIGSGNHGRGIPLATATPAMSACCGLEPGQADASARAFAAPLIDPDFLGVRDDMGRLARASRLMQDLLATRPGGLGRRETGPSRRPAATCCEQFISNADTLYHPVGTAAWAVAI